MQHRFAPKLSAMLAGAALVAGSLAGFGQVAVAGAQPMYPPGPSATDSPLELNLQPEPPGATYPPGPTFNGITIQD